MNNFEKTIPDYVKNILTTLENNGYEAYVVGGCVRDYLLSKPTNDWDICTSAFPEEVKHCLSDFHTVDTGIAHGTITAISGGNVCEITTFRCEEGYSDHRHPDSVSFTREITEDLKRRDFTVNAMAYSLEAGFVDPFCGRDDLKNKLIRCVGNPDNRFKEDALRIIRALRFSSCLGFSIAEKTKNAILKFYPTLEFVANERISSELRRLLLGECAHHIISDFSSVFNFIFKTELSPFPVYKPLSENLCVRLAYLLSTLDKKNAADILKKLKFDNATVDIVSFLIDNKNLNLISDKIAVLKLLSSFGRVKLYLLSDYLLLNNSESYKSFADTLPVITLKDLDLCGDDLIKIGITPGRQIKEILESALNAVLEEKCHNNKQNLIKFLL